MSTKEMNLIRGMGIILAIIVLASLLVWATAGPADAATSKCVWNQPATSEANMACEATVTSETGCLKGSGTLFACPTDPDPVRMVEDATTPPPSPEPEPDGDGEGEGDGDSDSDDDDDEDDDNGDDDEDDDDDDDDDDEDD